ncbi:hypothetical protein [Roseomonas populi]|uniref:Uncharacterized protein n=1 Tax=Roseomonas populi TaxID=3121582 RepID=A0ABT1XBD4_9PROT|nr:hypothetical protein [Roseomonas pecuniae]MCR0985014.1 hypothetical protein [Roseomonas pecuniae]
MLEATAQLDQVQAALIEQTRRAEVMDQRAAEFKEQLAVAEAKLQASHLMAIGIEAGLPALSDVTVGESADKGPGTRLTAIYEQAFGAKAAELGIEDPARFREG